jgi:epoxyqueuosine reductase QueG
MRAPKKLDSAETNLVSCQAQSDFAQAKAELGGIARKSGALVWGVAAADAFEAAPGGRRPGDLLPRAMSVLVVGGAQPRAGDWQSPNYQHMEVTTTSDRIHGLALKLARVVEDRYGYYAVCVPPGVDHGQQPFMSITMAADLAGCGSKSLAGPVLHPEYGFMYFGAIVTTMPLPADGPLETPACPAPECVEMYTAEGVTPCTRVCPIKSGGCLGGRIEDGRIVERQYDHVRCTTRVQNYWVPGFQKVLGETLREKDPEKQKMMLYSSMFSRTLWSMTYANVSQGQCAECMRVCPVGQAYRTKQ